MTSVAARGTTVLTIITLIFAPMFVGHGHHRHKVERLYQKRTTHQVIKCEAHKPCPKTKTETFKKYLKTTPKH